MDNTYKVVCISDTHNKHGAVDLPEGDLLIHAGDFSSMGYTHEVESFLKWIKKNSRKYTFGCVFIAGNHDRSFDQKYISEYGHRLEDDISEYNGMLKPKWLKDMLEEYADPKIGVRYLEGNCVQVDKLKIWGSPYTPSFYPEYWAFNLDRGDLIRNHWNTIPSDTDIVVTHGPAYGILDYIPDQEVNVGCADLKEVIEAIKPKLLVCGHIHEGYGITKSMSTIHLNSSICDANYHAKNKPHVVVVSK